MRLRRLVCAAETYVSWGWDEDKVTTVEVVCNGGVVFGDCGFQVEVTDEMGLLQPEIKALHRKHLAHSRAQRKGGSRS